MACDSYPSGAPSVGVAPRRALGNDELRGALARRGRARPSGVASSAHLSTGR
jgi:hypothetical protein